MITTAQIDLESLVAIELPPLPVVAMRVATLTQDLNSSTRSIADAIGCDPILAARVLRVANSPLYYFQRTVTALPMAVNALGNETIHSLVFVSVAADAFQGQARRPAMEVTLWEHSLAVGLAAREIMLLLGMRGLEEGFLCGLLHDFGQLLLLRSDAESYQSLILGTTESELLTAEEARFGYTHSEVGALAARRWDLPDAISDAIRHHHQPAMAHESTLMARVIDVADSLANKAGLGVWGESDRDLMQEESVIALHLTQEQLDEVWTKTLASVTATAALFDQ